MKHQVLVCDDELAQAQGLAEMLERAIVIQDDERQGKLGFLGYYTSYAATLQAVTDYQVTGGIYFLDIELSPKQYDRTGLDLAEAIKRQDPKAQIIFVTTHDELALMTFHRRIGALDYIIKDSTRSEFQGRITEALALALENIATSHTAQKYTFTYKIGHKIYNENIDDVVCIVTTERPHRLRLYKVDGIAEFNGNLKELVEQSEFLHPISQSCIVNAKNIKSIDLKERKILFVNGKFEYFPRRSLKQVKHLIDELGKIQ